MKKALDAAKLLLEPSRFAILQAALDDGYVTTKSDVCQNISATYHVYVLADEGVLTAPDRGSGPVQIFWEVDIDRLREKIDDVKSGLSMLEF